ncbi:PTS sugar transporter subunit IIA [Pseudodesulfovibrio indicus]|jgi:PTS system mannose-specific IIA component|uniref:PTS sugar transporter subunit IIA n=1 Tax=Pseudodesulfovibrio indicus TaxID=1716143 RepID=A0A126QPQ0_9BACT|nr:PTS sugar transporter subunit IIA [Pseudodesulfovibrio indicus]AMK11727.1 PTS sugar transporter subunit IIA [Pseudodesulfovibrio indicus]TDT88261.1 PTS system mannose-specific IIA component [Pseudodesulfovibrio indicus]
MAAQTEKKNVPIGVVLVTHGTLGETLLRAAEMVMGAQENCIAIGVDVNKGVDETLEAVRKAIQSVEKGNGVVALTDLFGGSPTTMSLSLMKSENLEVITGVNLPMLVATLQSRTMKLPALAEKAMEAGQQGIKVAGAMLRRKAKK